MLTLLLIVLANFLAQVPYFMYQYHGVPSRIGTTLMTFVLVWFLLAFVWLWQAKTKGYFLLLAFLIVEFLFYLSTQITQILSGKGILLHVLHPDDPILFIVFAIGYINLVASGFFVYYLILHKKELTESSTFVH
jgi:hypothetical protein